MGNIDIIMLYIFIFIKCFQYTCFEVSQHFIIFGASSGGLYVFRRQPCEFVQLLPNKVRFILSKTFNEKIERKC